MGRLIFIILIVGIGLTAAYQYGTVEEVTITVTDKERVVKSSGDNVESYYLVFCEEEIFKNDDALLHGKFRSSDIQGKLKVGETYKVKVFGWRVGFLSMYRNIVKIIE
jgi:transketolase N-terminal domain/subunit